MMQASALIKLLEDEISKHGDIPVEVYFSPDLSTEMIFEPESTEFNDDETPVILLVVERS